MPDKLLNGDATGSNSSDDKAMITKNTVLFGLRFFAILYSFVHSMSKTI